MPAYEVKRRRLMGRKMVERPHGVRELVWAPERGRGAPTGRRA